MLEDTLAFEELDPCCQKEIEEERHKVAVTKRLRKFDRSNTRFNEIQSVYGGVNDFRRCGCCSMQAVDYPLLTKVKRQFESARNDLLEDQDSDNEIDDSDDDEMFAGLDLDTLTPIEEGRLLEMRNRAKNIETASLMGFAVHMEDSVAHVNEMISQGRTVVCQFVSTNLRICALVDYALEGLATKYLGTVFRRIRINEDSESFRRKWNIASSAVDRGSIGPCLAVFFGRVLSASTSDLYQFSDNQDDDRAVFYTDELEKYLDSARGLSFNFSPVVLENNSIPFEDEGGDDEIVPYCGTPGCGRLALSLFLSLSLSLRIRV
jgi:hypothetical protein